MRQMTRLLCISLIGTIIAGCAPLAAIAYKASPEPTVPAEYKPANKPTLVLVENYENPDLYEVESERLGRDISYVFTEHKVVPVIEPHRLLDLKASKGDAFHKMDIPAIARALGARQVIYVNLTQFSVEPPIGSDTVRGKAEALVKVIDADTGRTLWPPDTSVGRDVRLETPDIKNATNASDITDTNNPAAVQEQVYEKLRDKISALFYDAPVDMVNGNEP